MSENGSIDAFDTTGYMILIVDDEVMARRLLRIILVRAGFQVVEAVDGQEALDQVSRDPPDLMLLDIMMPGIDGFEVCRILRSEDSSAELPVIMLSARTDSDSINQGLQVGADRYLTKPITPNTLVHEISEVLTGRN